MELDPPASGASAAPGESRLLVCAHIGASHTISTLHLAKRLLGHGFLITIVTVTPEIHSYARAQCSATELRRIRFESLTEEPLASIAKSPELIQGLGCRFMELASRLGAKSGAIRCVIAEYHAGYVYDGADLFDLPLVLYFPESATSAAFNLQLPLLLAKTNEIVREAVKNPHTLRDRQRALAEIPITSKELDDCLPQLNALGVNLTREQLHHYMKDATLHLATKAAERLCYARLSSWILVPSFEELEPACERMRALYGKRFLPVGPLFAPDQSDVKSLAETNEDLAWLDRWPQGSVVYIALGAMGLQPKEEILIVAEALDALELPVLLVIPSSKDDLLQDFIWDHAAAFGDGRWRISEWVPQKLVLDHSATGAFVTHCGWMSILESISSGVPLLAWSNAEAREHTDQFLNEKCVVEDWKVGIAMKRDSSGEVSQASAEESFRELLHGEAGARARENVLRLSALAKKAAGRGGSSAKNLKIFADGVKSGELLGTDTALLAQMLHKNPWTLPAAERARLKGMLDATPSKEELMSMRTPPRWRDCTFTTPRARQQRESCGLKKGFLL